MSPPGVSSVALVVSCVAVAMLALPGLPSATYSGRPGALVSTEELTNQPGDDESAALGAIMAGAEIDDVRF